MNIKEYENNIEEFLTYRVQERKATPRTVRTYKMGLNRLLFFWERHIKTFRYLGFQSIVNRYLIALYNNKKFSGEYKYKHNVTIRSFLRFLRDKKGIEVNLIKLNFRHENKLPEKAKREHVNQTLEFLNKNKENWSLENAIFRLLYSTGMYPLELVNLKIWDINLENSTIYLEKRILTLDNETVDALTLYLEHRTNYVKNINQPNFLFYKPSGEVVLTKYIRDMFARIKKKLNITGDFSSKSVRYELAVRKIVEEQISFNELGSFLGISKNRIPFYKKLVAKYKNEYN